MNISPAPIARIVAAWRGLDHSGQSIALIAGTAGLVIGGTVAASHRDSATAQSIAYASGFGVLASGGAALAGLLMLRSVRGHAAAQIKAGLDAAAGAALVDTASARAFKPAKLLLAGSGLVLGGVMAGRVATHRAQIDTIELQNELDSRAQRAGKAGKQK